MEYYTIKPDIIFFLYKTTDFIFDIIPVKYV